MRKVAEFNNKSTLNEAKFYALLGWHPTPGKPSSKQPMHGKGWNKLDHNGADEIIEQFNNLGDNPYNLGLLVGKQVVDIDLDSANCRKLAPYILPNTIKLKKGNEVTHYLYHMDEGLEPMQSKVFPLPTEDPSLKEMLVEVRGVDSRGNYQYTLASGSVHPSGLVIERIGDTPHVIKDPYFIYLKTRLLAFCDVLVRNWGGGSRNALAMGCTAFLLKQGYNGDEVTDAIKGICEVSGDDEKRLAQVESTIKKHNDGQPIAGEKILKEHLPSYVFDKIKSWFSNNITSLIDFDRDEILSLEIEKRWPYLVYLVDQACYTCDGVTLLKRLDVNNLFSRQLDSKSRIKLMDMSHKINGLGYYPQKELIHKDGCETYWNTWLDTKIVAKEGDMSPFFRHIERLCDKEQESIDALLSFMAHAVQKPYEKVRWMPVLIGGQGTGKTTLGDILSEVVGASNFASVSAQDMLLPFTTLLKNKLVVVVEEMRISKSTQTTALATALKEKITNDTLTVKEKFVPEYTIKNLIRFIGTSNHDSPIEIEEGDRRYYIIRSVTTGVSLTHEQRLETAQFFTKYRKWLKEEQGLEAILHYLKHYDISKFNPNFAPKMSEVQQKNKNRIIKETNEPHYYSEVSYWVDMCETDIVNFRDFKEGFDFKFSNVRVSDKIFSSFLRGMGCRKIKKQVSIDGGKKWFIGWVVKNVDHYKHMSDLEIARDNLQKKSIDEEF